MEKPTFEGVPPAVEVEQPALMVESVESESDSDLKKPEKLDENEEEEEEEFDLVSATFTAR
jgi:hypothetical protein